MPHWNSIQARPAFPQEACGSDVELLKEVESLLSSSRETLGYARKAVPQLARQQTFEAQPAGRRVGAFKLLWIIGEEGMGTVYLAERAERENLALWRKVGGSHIDVIYAENNLGTILLAEGDWRQAEPLLRNALTARQSQLGEKHPLVAISPTNLGRVSEAKGNYKKPKDTSIRQKRC